MSAKHTPGRWEAGIVGLAVTIEQNTPCIGVWAPHAADAGKPAVMAVCGDVGAEDEDISIANARLIAAAPQMLEALQNVNRLVAEAASTGFNPHSGDWAERLFHSQQKTFAAIAAATGGEP